MEEIMAEAFINNKVVMNLLFLIAYEVIISIISYKILEQYSWKETIMANCIITLGVSLIKLHGLGLIRILITVLVQTATMVAIEIYMYNKEYEFKDYILRTSSLNLFAFGRRSYGLYLMGND